MWISWRRISFEPPLDAFEGILSGPNKSCTPPVWPNTTILAIPFQLMETGPLSGPSRQMPVRS